jgi:hypothetical protein
MANRNLDRVLNPSFLDGLESWVMTDVRAARSDVQILEDAASFLRRLIQARLDIIGNELAVRAGMASDDRTLVESLTAILADHSQRPSLASGRLINTEPGDLQTTWAGHRADVAMRNRDIAEVGQFSTEELRSLTDSLSDLEHEVSAERRSLHDLLDRLQGDVVRRYKTGEVSVEGLLR